MSGWFSLCFLIGHDQMYETNRGSRETNPRIRETNLKIREKRTDGTKIGGEMGQDGQRRKKYPTAVIDGIKRKSRIFVGDSIVRKTDSRLSKGEDVVVCLPGARIEHVTERE